MESYKVLCFVCHPEGQLSKPTIFVGRDEKKLEAAFNKWKKLNPIGMVEQVNVEVVE